MLPGGKKLLFRDDFFSKFSETEGYLNKSNIPGTVVYFKESFPEFYNTPILFGTNQIIRNEDRIICNADLFASAFFMLSRWEEYVLKERDSHNRFPGALALSIRHKFHDRPVVDEYVEIIWSLLCMAGYKGDRKRRTYSIMPTHDIDRLIFWNKKNKAGFFRNFTGDIFKRKSISIAFRRATSFYKSLTGISNDPCFRFYFFMEKAEERGVKANFYFIAGCGSSYDPEIYIYTSFFREIISEIKKRGHIICIHPSYNSYNNLSLLRSEIEKLAETSNIQIKSGRQHYLRFEVPATWNLLEECRLENDSSMYFSGYPGFRCGTCHEFHVFDIIGRKTLNLRELPLLLMDTCLYSLNPDAAAETIGRIKNEVSKHNGNFVFVWHNCLNINQNSIFLSKILEEKFYE